MSDRIEMSDNEFRIKELERLFSERKITLEEYLDMRTKMEGSQLPVNEPRQPSQNLFHTKPEPQRALQTKPSKKPYKKIAIGILLSALILASGYFAWGFLNPVEALAIEGYSMKVSKCAVVFNLKNVGNTDISISEVRMNGYLNQSILGFRQGWNGTTALRPQQTGSLYVYLACYFYILEDSMPSLSSLPTDTELDDFFSWVESYSVTFTFVTDTERQYDYRADALTILFTMAWAGSLTYTFMRTEELQYITRSWGTNNAYIDLTVKNTGTSPLTMSKVEINGVNQVNNFDFDYGTGGAAGNQTTATLDGGASKTVRIWYSFVSGNKYDFTIITASNNKYTYTTTAP